MKDKKDFNPFMLKFLRRARRQGVLHKPHQGAKEKARRMKQIALGQIKIEEEEKNESSNS